MFNRYWISFSMEFMKQIYYLGYDITLSAAKLKPSSDPA